MPLPPGSPALDTIWDKLGDRERDLFFDHLMGGTSADWLATTLRKYGHEVSASTIRTYRRAVRQSGV
ncbi:hypothetical protein SEA_YOSIF_45 [Streptomyces phage Yosif]|uniref:Helix-turn-helix DNA binding domain protein n=1 Tax=Streptomyces phage Yosif TaxID=2201421 RepID=A0A2Z4QBU4_9CAUD|nr:hypothetical protein KGG71_gp45 [Streptomyces phage Yosif]AWY07609.1 hypothetical protein SEA_YOSIF_45 [Streptomyces phage Yosif]